MTHEIRQHEYFTIPAMPGLAVTVEGQRVPKSLQQGDVLNVLSGNLDGSMLYVVAWLGQGRGSVYEGWDIRDCGNTSSGQENRQFLRRPK